MNHKNNKSNYNNYNNSKNNKNSGNKNFSNNKKEVSPPPQYSPNHLTDILPDRTAIAPYNFIPLNEKVVNSQFSNETPDLSVYSKNTGYIDLDFDTKSPLYIRDTYNKKEMNIKDFLNSDFFSPGGLPKIPGSSQRGMIKTLMEIITYSKFGFVDDKTLYFRDFTNDPLKKIYSSYGLAMPYDKVKKQASYKVGCGILYKEGKNYFIDDYGNPTRISKVDTEIEAKKIQHKLNSSEWDYFVTKDENKLIIISGRLEMTDRKRLKKKDSVLNLMNDPKKIKFTKEDIKDYKNDVSRASNDLVPDLIKLANQDKNGVPVFFYQWTDTNGNPKTSIGHTGMLRLPYKLSIGEHIPKELKDKKITDFVEAMFGDKDKFAGRLYFEDAVCKNNSDVYMNEASPKILSNPKPTTFQHYLIQNSDEKIHLYHYNSQAPIRGNKLYWHKDVAPTEWQASTDEINSHSTQYTKIKAVKSGTIFKGRIRFENLTNEELGALLFALDLPENCCHKIGMGKPLGLGSIKLTPKLFLSNRENRYSDLLSEWTTSEETNFEEYKQKFATYILNNLNNNEKNYEANDLWQEERLKELKTMLDFSLKPNKNEIKYMELGEFKNRKILPKPSKVKK